MFTSNHPTHDASKTTGTRINSPWRNIFVISIYTCPYIYIYTYVRILTFSNGEVWNEAFARFAEFEANTSLFSIRWKWIPSRFLFLERFLFSFRGTPRVPYITFTLPYGLMFTPLEITLCFSFCSKTDISKSERFFPLRSWIETRLETRMLALNGHHSLA